MSLEELEAQQSKLEHELHRTQSQIEQKKNQQVDEHLAHFVKVCKEKAHSKQHIQLCLQKLLQFITAVKPCLHKEYQDARQRQIQNLVHYYMEKEELRGEFFEILRISLTGRTGAALDIVFRVSLGMTPLFRFAAVNISYDVGMEKLFPNTLHGHRLQCGDYFNLNEQDQRRILQHCIDIYPEQQLEIDIGERDRFSMDHIFEFLDTERCVSQRLKSNPHLFEENAVYCLDILKQFAVDTLKQTEQQTPDHQPYIASSYLKALLFSSVSPKTPTPADIYDGCDYISLHRPFYYTQRNNNKRKIQEEDE